MGGTAKSRLAGRRPLMPVSATGDPAWVRWLIGIVSLSFLGLFLVVPLVAVFTEALRKGLGAYLESFQNRDALAAIKLTLAVAAIAVPLNVVFGLAASWAIAKFDFRGKSLHGERLLDEVQAFVKDTVAGDHIGGVTGHEQALHGR